MFTPSEDSLLQALLSADEQDSGVPVPNEELTEFC